MKPVSIFQSPKGSGTENPVSFVFPCAPQHKNYRFNSIFAWCTLIKLNYSRSFVHCTKTSYRVESE